MNRMYILLILVFILPNLFAQNNSRADTRTSAQTAVIKTDGTQNSWMKSDADNSSTSGVQSSDNDNVTFNPTSEGIFISIINGTNNIKLFALTGQLLLNGDLSQGRFFIPTRKGIFFLRVNNKSYKVVCK